MVSTQNAQAIKQKNKAVFIIFIFFTAAASILRLLLTRFEIDPYSNLYGESEFPVELFDYAIAIIIVGIYVLSKFIYRRKMWSLESQKNDAFAEVTDNMIQGSQTLVFSSSLAGIMLVTSSGMQVYDFIANSANEAVSLTARLGSYIRENTFDFIIFFLAIFSAIYFFKTASLNPTEIEPVTENKGENSFKSRQPFSQGYMIFSFFPIIWSFLNIFKCFFDMSKSVNSPIRIYELVCFLSISLYFVAESRMLIGRRETSKFFTFAYTTMLLISLSAVPNLILSAFWLLETSVSLMVYAVQVSFLLYIVSRVYSQIKYGKFMLIANEIYVQSDSKKEKQSNIQSAANK